MANPPYRVDINGNLQVQHPETGAWVPGVVLLQIAGGLISQLSTTQFQSVTSILANTEKLVKLDNILSRIELMLQAIILIQADESTSAGALSKSIAPNISNSVVLLSAIESLVRTTNLTVETQLNALSKKVVDYTTHFNDLQAAVIGVRDRTDLLIALTTTLRDTLTTTSNTLTNLSTVVNQRLTTIDSTATSILTRITNLYSSRVMINVVTLTGANVETTIALPASTKSLSFKSRPNASTGLASELRYAFATGQVTNLTTGMFRTLPPFNEFNENRLLIASGNLFVAAADTNSLVVEVEAWSS